MRSLQVAKTDISGVAVISTVQLPANLSYGNPFETMIFSENENINGHDSRSGSLDEALLAHMDAIAVVLKWIEQ